MPAGRHRHGGGQPAGAGGELVAVPELRVVGKPGLPVGQRDSGGEPVQAAQRQLAGQLPEGAGPQRLPDQGARLLLPRHLIDPLEHRLQPERAAGLDQLPRAGTADLHCHGRVIRQAESGQRPLGNAQVARAPGAERAGIPRLRPQPLHRGQPVADLRRAERIQLAAGPEGAPAALHDALEPALGEQPSGHQPEHPPPAVRAADQDQRQPAGARAAGAYRSASSVTPSAIGISRLRCARTDRVWAGGSFMACSKNRLVTVTGRYQGPSRTAARASGW